MTHSKSKGAIGASIPRSDARGKVTGRTQYGGDLARPDALHVHVLRSHYPHAEIKGIDLTEAKALPGVVAIFTAQDMPGTNMHGLIRRDQEVLATRFVRFTGDSLAIVVAETRAIAKEAARLIKVDYQVLPGVYTIEEALAPGAPCVHPEGNILARKPVLKGDALAAMQEAEVVIEGSFKTQTVDHAFLDVEAGMAEMDGDTVLIHAAGQWVHEEQRLVALALGLPTERVRIIQPVTGGAFGGREDINIQIYLGLAALKLQRQVRLDYDRAESVNVRHKRHPLHITYTLGAKRDGTLVAAKVKVLADEGAYASTGVAVLRKAASHATGPYRVPNVLVDVTGVFTNQNPTGAMRGFGAAQMAIAYEGAMDLLANALGMDRVELRRKNLLKEGEGLTTGQILNVSSALECLDAAQEAIGWEGRDYTTGKSYIKRGYGVSSFCFGLGYGDGFPDTSRARVRFAEDDVLEVYTGAVEVGQGLTTAMAQVAAHDLGVDPTLVRVINADTHRTPEAGSSSATRQTYFTGSAIKLAAFELRHQLMDIAGTLLPIHPDELRFADGFIHAEGHPDRKVALKDVLAAGRQRGFSLEGHGLFQPPTIEGDPNGLSPRAFITYLFGSHAAEVLVDVETGEVKVERLVAVHDVGKAINPRLVEGQIEGGVVQGLGMALMEEVIRKEGKILNPNFTDYILPTMVDVPFIQAIIVEHHNISGPYGAHGVGEPPLIGTPPAILAAIADAIGARVAELPATPERVWRAIQKARIHADRRAGETAGVPAR